MVGVLRDGGESKGCGMVDEIAEGKVWEKVGRQGEGGGLEGKN